MKMSFEIVFEIYFSTAEEYMGLLNELAQFYRSREPGLC